MSRDELITCLIEQPRAIQAAENALLEIEESRRQLCHQIETQEAELLLNGTVDGKNAEVRSAQLRALTASQRALLAETDRRAAAAKLTLHRRQNEFAALRSIARLLAGATD